MIARRLALCSGMDFAIMSGGDVAPLGEDAVNQLHNLFHWAKTSRKGLLVFIDEAEAFLSARTGGFGYGSSSEGSPDIHTRNALNALLYQTGTPSHNFMLVLATNRPQDLDVAVLDRIDVSIPITPPALPQRIELIKLYMEKYVLDVAKKSQESPTVLGYISNMFSRSHRKRYVEPECCHDETVYRIAASTDGFSGREISKLFIAAQYAMYLSTGGLLTLDGLMKTVQFKVEEHAMKKAGFPDQAMNSTTSRVSPSNDKQDDLSNSSNPRRRRK